MIVPKSPRKNAARRLLSFSVLSSMLLSLLPIATIAAEISGNDIQVNIMPFIIDGSYSVSGNQPTGSGQFKNGSVQHYPEGSCIPVLLTAENKTNSPGDISLFPYFDYFDGVVGVDSLEQITIAGEPISADNLNDFNFSKSELTSAATFNLVNGGSVSTNVSGSFGGNTSLDTATSATDQFRHYRISLLAVPAKSTVNVLFCARLGVDAASYSSGAPLSVRANNGGNENISIQTNQLLALPSLTLQKVVVGGTAQPDEFSFVVSPAIEGQTNFSIPSGQNSVTIPNIQLDGNYTVTEQGPSGYTLQGITGTNCSAISSTATATVAAGKPATNATCTFTNEAIVIPPPQLTVIKQVVNDNGRTKTVGDFTLHIDGTVVSSGVATTVIAGTHIVSEDADAGYTGLIGGDCASDGSVTLTTGESKVCTITNDDLPVYTAATGTVIVIKNVINDNSGTMQSGDFTLHATGNNPSLTNFPGSASGISITLNAGNYIISEDAVAGYTGSYSTDCLGTLAVGETKTCTVTNNDNPPTTGSLTVIKNVINDNGRTNIANDFTLNVTGTNPSLTSFPGSTTGTIIQLEPGYYTVSEPNAGMYVVTLSADCVGAIQAGESKTCTVTNDDSPLPPAPSYLTIQKVLINDNGGTKQVSDFTVRVDGSIVGFNQQIPVAAGTYTVSEDATFGYIGTLSGDCAANGSVSIAAGESKVCTITNDDQPGTIIVSKDVLNNNGHTLTAEDFTFSITATNPSQSLITGNSATGVIVTVDAGSFAVTETPTPYYTPSYGADCSGTIAIGETKNCLIVNDDNAPVYVATTGTIIVVKQVINDNGGVRTPSDFTMTVDATNPSSSSFPGSSQGTAITVTAGSYSVDETSTLGYTKSLSSECSGTVGVGQVKTCTITNDDAPMCIANADVMLVLDRSGSISGSEQTQLKTAANAFVDALSPTSTGVHMGQSSFSTNGSLDQILTGSASALHTAINGLSFGGTTNLYAGINIARNQLNGANDRTPDTDDAHPDVIIVVTDGNPNQPTNESTARTQATAIATAAKADGMEIYTVGIGSDVNSSFLQNNIATDAGHHFPAVSFDQLSSALQAIANCQPPAELSKIIIKKTVVNDDTGTKISADFTMQVIATNASTSTFPGSDAGTTVFVDPGAYSVDEMLDAGYAKTLSADCAGTIGAGETKTCIITNDDITPPFVSTTGTLMVIKQVINDNSGTLTSSDFTLHVTGSNPSTSTFPGSINGTTVILTAGAYMVTEDTVAGYTGSFSTDCLGTLSVGETKICTITNNDNTPPPPTTGVVNVIKHVINDNGGLKVASDFTMHASGTNPSTTSFVGSENGIPVTLGGGAYTITEDALTGYAGSLSSDCSGVLIPGETKTCTITNDDIYVATTGTVRVIKTVINSYGGTLTSADFTMHASGTAASTTTFPGNATGTDVTLDAGAYAITEDLVSGYSGTSTTDCVGTLAVGETKTCTFTNSDNAPPQADLVMSKTVSNSSARPTNTLRYTLTATNIGPDTAISAFVTDALPAGLQFVTSTATLGSYSQTTGIWSIGDMLINQTETLIIDTIVTTYDGALVNTAVASSTLIDPNHNNNSSSATTNVSNPATGGGGGSSGGGGGGGGGSGGGIWDGPTGFAPAPTPAVLGTSTEVPSVPVPTPAPKPEPQILGATEELPRTGMPLSVLFLPVLITVGALIHARRK